MIIKEHLTEFVLRFFSDQVALGILVAYIFSWGLSLQNDFFDNVNAMDADILYPLDNNIGEESWRRRCGCLRTSEKLKRILDSFPAPPPPTPDTPKLDTLEPACISAYCTHLHSSGLACNDLKQAKSSVEICNGIEEKPIKKSNKSWQVVGELVQLVQLSVTATALALYYLIYCYMQLIYFTLSSALYFHNADGAMKITIAVVTLTSLVIAFNILLKMERVFIAFR